MQDSANEVQHNVEQIVGFVAKMGEGSKRIDSAVAKSQAQIANALTEFQTIEDAVRNLHERATTFASIL
ncbi:methyl-accepting chemotaxis protein [Paenibacillus phyllosphaerae]|uniref:Methyl-accepting chemotaxis protein n=1 Tax=Paenibacillus phyllosphaerae TaxID=274593 RepID=A0A7W5AZR1_9BACL|nr:hypothetical protein [Paenibacillus phyllosphaerae]MBB3111728.1 methyl-accepting chemotaxis protein [Paenibacillus phyllosphaerae]